MDGLLELHLQLKIGNIGAIPEVQLLIYNITVPSCITQSTELKILTNRLTFCTFCQIYKIIIAAQDL